MIDNLHPHSNVDPLRLARKSLNMVLFFSIIGEIIFFPSLGNFLGCAMELIVWLIFRTFFLKKKIIIEHPFSFLAFLSIFLARFIPLPATLIEGKPITYGFENPLETFFYETLMFIVCSLAFYTVAYAKRRGNNLLRRTLYRLNFLSADRKSVV